ncbi:hypothetical protein I4641_02410 [Waterburya agarophytonicola K14]|uniref:Uncharacterized protein n=1 Tax=Waterburya agarophytonicola KI4 TaxID=2874699 RepID=A0A964BLY0_9CYAN|nr:hypothetical protein [Waterburya agarophytonicola]MCC0175834.1 hypothetical protein [Waterburya agarophytonicola KI4]
MKTYKSPLEKLVGKKIKSVKPKSKQPGYLKSLIKTHFSLIEDALANGCEYDDIAQAISETEVTISPSTLKKYHQTNRTQKNLKTKSNQSPKTDSDSNRKLLNGEKTKINSEFQANSDSDGNNFIDRHPSNTLPKTLSVSQPESSQVDGSDRLYMSENLEADSSNKNQSSLAIKLQGSTFSNDDLFDDDDDLSGYNDY